MGDVVWSDHDIYNTAGALVYPGTLPSDSVTVIDIPSILVGDVPDQIKNGETDEDELAKVYPSEIDLSKLAEGKASLNEMVTDVIDKLSTGQMTYDQYMDSVQGETSSDPTPDGSDDVEVKTGLGKLVDFFTGTSYVASPLQAINFGELFDLFPFNIPAGIYETINFWSASATPPSITVPVPSVSGGGVYVEEYTLDFADIPGMNTIAALIRGGELILFAVGLLLITRKVTKW